MTARLTVTGAGGFVGRHLCDAARDAGHALQALTRTDLDLERASDAALAQALAPGDVVVHCAGIAHEAAEAARRDPQLLYRFNRDLTERLYRAAAAAGAARFVWLSSIKVLGETSTQPLPVSAPLAPASPYPDSKAQGERQLQAAMQELGLPVTIIRPPLVYGPGVGANFRTLLRWVLSGRPLPLGRATAPRSLVGVRNLCSAVLASTAAPPGIYHVADGPALGVAALLRAVAAAARQDISLWRAPPAAMAAAATLIGRRSVYQRLFEPLELHTADSEARLGWRPPHTLEAQLQETVTWYRSQP